MESTKPFPEVLSALLDERDWSHAELARRTRKEFKWGNQVTISDYLREVRRPSQRAMENIAAALRIKPETFAEFRLMKARHELDPKHVGLKRALKRLEESS
jgi:transcriptional regulator with XRE-family HTH domain